MSISTKEEFEGMRKASELVALTLKRMREYAAVGMSTKELDDFGANFMKSHGANSAPELAYGFPGWTCISLNNEIAHGIPSKQVILQEGDLINIDVSGELNGFWSDNGGSFIIGRDIYGHQPLVEASKRILEKAINNIKGGIKISEIGRLIETEAKRSGYTVIRNLTGHGIGRKLHEEPHDIANFYDRYNQSRFRKNSVVAVETFISTNSTFAETLSDGWTMVGNKGGYVCQHEHTIVITNGAPIILTEINDIWN